MAARKVAPKSNVIVLDSAAAKAEVEEKEDLFAVDGKTYQVRKNPSAALTMRVLAAFRDEGDAQATDLALREMLGEEGYKALTECESLTKDNLSKVVKIIIEKVIAGTVLDPKENVNPETS